MKQILFIMLITMAYAGNAQEGFKLILRDNIGRTDTVVFGMDYAATNGIDPEFGEVDLYGTTLDSLEIRSVMRDLDSHLCVTTSPFENYGEPLIFPENIDLKKDFREFALGSPLSNNFEFTLNAIEYPLTIISDFTQWFPHGTWYVWVGLLNSNCEIISSPPYPNVNEVETLMVDEDGSVSSIIVKFDHEVGVNRVENNNYFELYPNPVTDKSTLIINKTSTENAIISIYSITGNLVFMMNINGQKEIEINKSDFEKGLYLLRYLDQDGFSTTCKIVIQ
ncbi:MAG: T9SS type A sorting domain-containing protein [Bacteroidales bacterium]|nr:T9SS type A sorting domain-containing protein [Bacteroidales bacterium]MDD4671315.1 T9SS type A sorting domain-containing protein [Bacteroidales bacterium]MDY0348392.1 T9SS type A sorting domain-containing protein [Tenuifilaceae bacterium]